MKKQLFFTISASCLSLLLLVGCSTNLISGFSKSPEQEAKHHLKLAEGSPPPRSLEYRLKAALVYLQNNQAEEASTVLREIQTQEVGMEGDMRRTVLAARHLLLRGEKEQSLALLQNLSKRVAALSPNELSRTQFGNASQRKIALLLPINGSHSAAAKTIRDGFIAAYYLAQHSGNNASVEVYDTSGGLNTAYEKAMVDHADMIVGPLTKPEVQQIAGVSLPIPVLALNTIPVSRQSSKLIQFGILPEDEVIALANFAHRHGRKRAIIIAPQSAWGSRMSNAFKTQWTAMGGKVVETILLQPKTNWTYKIRSNLRSNDYSPRTDVDMIFLAASPELAKELRPLLSFEGQASYPIYATTSIYGGQTQAQADPALNDIHFCDMPWVLNAPHVREARQYVSELWPSSESNSPRYFALGMDAFRLARMLADNQGLPQAGTTGVTGDLFLNNKQHVERHLVCAKFVQGVPVLE